MTGTTDKSIRLIRENDEYNRTVHLIRENDEHNRQKHTSYQVE